MMPGVVSPESSLRIVFVASEAIPFAKTGGLADVVGVLPRELARLGHQVRLVLPRYGSIGGDHGFVEWSRLSVPSMAGTVEAGVERSLLPDPASGQPSTAEVFAIRHDAYFARPGLYQEHGRDYPDNLVRFSFFCRAAMELLRVWEAESWIPQVLHGHDWQAALCMVYAKSLYRAYTAYHGVAAVLTIHNLGYQGVFPVSQFPLTGLPWSLFQMDGLEFYGSCNLLKGGLLFADYLTTVSETYANEIQTPEFGAGLEGVIVQRRDRLVGIPNGIESALWNPETDSYLPAPYSSSNLAGKQRCKAALQREMALPERAVPLLGIVARLTPQKGVDLVMEILPELMALDLQLVVLGTGDPVLEREFQGYQDRYPEKIGVKIGFDEGLAHRIEAGADIFVMPSRYEPCGLNQLYSLRYGTVPVVRRTGGLADTVVQYSPLAVREGRATGFLFGEATPDALLNAVLLALSVYRDAEEWGRIMRAGMKTDVSWHRAAQAYTALYRRASAVAREARNL